MAYDVCCKQLHVEGYQKLLGTRSIPSSVGAISMIVDSPVSFCRNGLECCLLSCISLQNANIPRVCHVRVHIFLEQIRSCSETCDI
jgi:hypothetical protein